MILKLLIPIAKIYSDNFSGVTEIYQNNIIWASQLSIDVNSFYVESGNFRLVVLQNDEIIHDFVIGEDKTLVLEDVKGDISIRMAGESANFQFYIRVY